MLLGLQDLLLETGDVIPTFSQSRLLHQLNLP